MTTTRLVVQADDFGMCHAVNEGVARAFSEGLVTQASVMAPCPWIDEATRLARELAMPVGVHGTLTCEWDHLRWRPLTTGTSLLASDGTQHRKLDSAIAEVDAGEAERELLAQVEALRNAGLDPAYVDCHMGPASKAGFEAACVGSRLPFLYPLLEPSLRFESIAMLSPIPAAEKKPWLLERLENLAPGDHLLVTHPAVDSPELRAVARPEAENFVWAEPNRTSDLAVLLDAEVARRVIDLGIGLVSVAEGAGRVA